MNEYDVLLSKKSLKTFGLILGGGLLLTIISAIFARGGWRFVTVLLSAVSTVFIVIFLISNYAQYRKNKVVSKKLEFKKTAKQASKALAKEKIDLSLAKSKLKKITAQYNQRIESIEQQQKNQAISTRNKLDQYKRDEQNEIQQRLLKAQQAYVSQMMHTTLVEDAKLVGIGRIFKKRLIQNGICCAADVYKSRLEAISGFGEKKVTIMMKWKYEVRNHATATQPKKLSNEILVSIHNKYEKFADEVQAIEVDEQARLADLLEETRRAKNQAENDQQANIHPLTESVAEKERIAKEAREKSKVYKKISFVGFVYQGIAEALDGQAKWLVSLAPAAAILAVLFSCLFSGISGSVSSLGMMVDSLPTHTSTVTNTLPPTATSTNTATSTATSTNTATITFTPTITLTETITLTPTITFTPTVTSTITQTPTLTPTLRGGEAVSCIPSNEREVATVTRIIDGDTIEVSMGGELYYVRYIGVDAPETNEYYETQATAANATYVPVGTVITMIKDVSETDRYDRLLRYVISGSTFVNYQLVARGYAEAKKYEPDTACASVFSAAGSLAKTDDLGMYRPTPTPVPYVYPTRTASSGDTQNCDPSYPDFCIAPYPPDLDCKNIGRYNFTVLPPDPHGFDGDGDGIGCEK